MTLTKQQLKKRIINKGNKKLGFCSFCNRQISIEYSLLLLSNDKWYCFSCICKNKILFKLLRKNGYWIDILKDLTRFNINYD